MALTVLQRPKGYIILPLTFPATYTNGSSTVTRIGGHGLSTGNFIYISTGQAIGFWYVNVLTSDTYTISEYSTATPYSFLGSGTIITALAYNEHGWNAVHLPIVYKLSSSLWPTNSVDTVRTVSSYSNDNGYVKLTCSGALKSDVTELEFVKVIFNDGTSAVYQIIAWWSTSVVTINLAYIGGITFTSVQYYYNNYHARIRIYAGLVGTHTFASQKPYTLLTEIRVIPDSSGIVTININEFLKQRINILMNDLNKGTLPNDLDAFCQFYITYAEAYDYSQGGYTLLDFIGSYTDDSGTFTGYASNSDLPFKNRHSGAMSDYIVTSNATTVLNEPFTSSLDGFANVGAGDPWYWSNQDGGIARVDYLSGTKSQLLQKALVLTKGKYYTVNFYSRDQESFAGTVTYRFFGDADQVYSFQPTIVNNLTDSKTFIFSPTKNYQTFSVRADSSTTASVLILEMTIKECNIQNFLTPSVFPIVCPGQFFDLSFINNYGVGLFMKRELYSSGVLIGTIYDIIPDYSVGVYRYQVDVSFNGEDRIDLTVVYQDYPGFIAVTETKTIAVDSSCCFNYIDLSWKNYLGEMDYWRFKSNSDFGVNIEGIKTTVKNFFSTWPKSWGANADTIRQETSRQSSQTITVRAENLTADQINDLFRIKTSVLVQIVNSRTDRRTVLVDSDSFVYYQQREKLFNLTFKIVLTDNFPSQAL